MVAISFSVFKDKILDGTKRQTIRPLRKRSFNVGDNLQLYWHMRQKDCEKLQDETCVEVFSIHLVHRVVIRIREFEPLNQILNYAETTDLARRDGFSSVAEMFDWFEKQYGQRLKSLTFQIIRW